MKFISVLISLLLVYVTPVSARQELGASKSEADVHVGCLYPMSGINKLYGEDSVVAIQLALEDIDESMPAAPKIRIVVEDTKLKSSRSIRLVRDFVRDEKTTFICGVVSSSIALEIVKIVGKLGVIFIGTDHGSSRLTTGALIENYFRLSNNTRQSMHSGARYIQESFKEIISERPIRIAYIGPDYDYGYQSWQDLRTGMKGLNIPYEPVAVLWPSLFEIDYSAHILALKEVKADLIVNTLWGRDFITFLRQGGKTDLFKGSRMANFDTGGNFETFSKAKGEVPLGLIMSARHHLNWPDTKENTAFVKRFYKKAGRYPSYAAEGAYSGVLAIAHALVATKGSTDLAALRHALSSLSLKLPEDPEGFTSFMNPVDHQIQQVIAIGEVIDDNRYPPAKRMLGNWRYYYPLEIDHLPLEVGN